MTRRQAIGGFATLFVMAAGIAGPPVLGARESLAARVDRCVAPYVEARCFSGAVLLARKGEILAAKGYGLANYELGVANTPATKFHIASVSKTFTAAAIMILAQRGLLAPEDPLSKFIPDYPKGDRISVHQLLVHASGIPNVNDFPEYAAKSRFPQTPGSLIAMFKDRPLIMVPGERYSYSNSNYNVLAFLIEKLSGLSYGEFLKKEIFDPLGMASSGHDGNPAALIEGRASGYVPAGFLGLENSPYLDWSAKTGNGSLYSTVEDLYKWDRALFTDRILLKAARDRVFAAHAGGTGYGWFIGEKLKRRVIRMSGRSPGFQCEIQRYVDDDACVIVLGNNYSGTSSLVADGLAALLFGEPDEPFFLAATMDVGEKAASPLAGRYQGGEDFIRPGAALAVLWKDGHLWLDWGGGYVAALVPLADGSYLDRLFGGRVRFIIDGRGVVDGLVWRSGRDYPAKKAASSPAARLLHRRDPFEPGPREAAGAAPVSLPSGAEAT